MTRDSYINRHSLASLPDYFVFNYPLFKAFFLRELVTISRIPYSFYTELPYFACYYHKFYNYNSY